MAWELEGGPPLQIEKMKKRRFCEQELIRKRSLKFYGNCLASKEVAWNEKASKETASKKKASKKAALKETASKEAALKEKVSKEAASRESATMEEGGFFNGCLYGLFY